MITYSELDRAAEQLARRLNARRTPRDAVIGVALEPGADFAIAVMAILKAGAGFVVISPSRTDEQILSRLKAGGVSIVLSSRRPADSVAGENLVIKRLDDTAEADDSGQNRDSPACTGLACVRFTEGAMGTPKAVTLSHRALLSQIEAAALAWGSNYDRVLLPHSAANDLLFCLCNGHTAVLMTDESKEVRALLDAVKQYRCTAMFLSTRAWLRWMLSPCNGGLKAPPRLGVIVLDGECRSDRALRRWFQENDRTVRLLAGYNAAECGRILATIPPPGAVEIEDPRATAGSACQRMVLDDQHQPTPVGVAGELYIDGASLAEGYWDACGLTGSEFSTDFGSGARLFRSGDQARRLPGGTVEVMGPRRPCINLHGFRAALEDADAVLLEQPGVRNAACVVHSENGSPHIAAFVELQSPGSSDVISRLHCAAEKELPDYLKPASITVVESLPEQRDGETDTRRLIALCAEAAAATPCSVPPRDEIESRLAGVWEYVLGVKPIGIKDNFFDLGGNSLLAMRLFTRVKELWGRNLPLSVLFESPTIEGLSQLLRIDAAIPPWSSVVPIKPEGSKPPIFFISGLGGNVVRFRELARSLGPEQPVYALQPLGLDGRQPLLTRLEDMAKHYIEEIRKVRARGVYHLAGYSFGGLVTFEMAQQLRADNESLGMVALLDQPELSYVNRLKRSISARDRLQIHKLRLHHLVRGPDRIDYVKRSVQKRVSRLIFRLFRAAGRPLPQSIGTIEDVNAFAARNYHPKSYDGTLTVLCGEWRAKSCGENPDLGWGKLARQVNAHRIPGHHDDIMAEPNLSVLASRLISCIDGAMTDHAPGDDGRTSSKEQAHAGG